MNEQIKDRDESGIYEQYEAALFRAAFYEIERKESEQLLSGDVDEKDTEQMDAFFERTEATTLRRIERQIRHKQRLDFVRNTLPKAAQAAAAVLLLAFITASVAIAAVPAVRVRVLRLLVDIRQDHTELQLVENPDASFDVPEGWQGKYFPSYIPEGYELEFIENLHGVYNLEYVNGEGLSISYSELGEDALTDINTEDALIDYITIHEQPALMATRNTGVQVTWAESDRYFIIWTQTDAETTTAIANEVLKIN